MDNHTAAKHEILRKYLQAWLPIMTSTYDRVMIIDGFAGPGIYEGGQIGSPLIALDVLREYENNIDPQKLVRFLFIEKDSRRCRHLKHLLEESQQKQSFPAFLQCDIVCGNFVEVLTQELNILEKQKEKMPVFAFIDPFGYSHTPLHVITRLMKLPSCEILSTFMYEEINRFLTADYSTKIEHYDELFGTREWNQITMQAETADGREQLTCDLYTKQLRAVAQIRYVRSFQMINQQNTTDYFLFFGTNNRKGLEKMKDAMWKVDPDSGYSFSDRTNKYQLQLFEKGPDYDLLKRLLVSQFSGKTTTIEQIDEYILAETPFRLAGYKENVLKKMEDASEIRVLSQNVRRMYGTYPPGTSLFFKQDMPPPLYQQFLW